MARTGLDDFLNHLLRHFHALGIATNRDLTVLSGRNILIDLDAAVRSSLEIINGDALEEERV
jgi:hypothetical protein